MGEVHSTRAARPRPLTAAPPGLAAAVRHALRLAGSYQVCTTAVPDKHGPVVWERRHPPHETYVGSRPDRDVGRAQALAESRRGPFQWLWHWLGRAAPLRERGRVARGAAPATHGTPGRTPSRDGRAGAASHTHRGPTAVLDPARAIQSKGASPLTDVGPTRTAPSGLGSQALCRDNHAPQKSLQHGDVSVSTAGLAPSTRGPRGSRTGGAKCRGRAQTEGRRSGSRVDSFRA